MGIGEKEKAMALLSKIEEAEAAGTVRPLGHLLTMTIQAGDKNDQNVSIMHAIMFDT